MRRRSGGLGSGWLWRVGVLLLGAALAQSGCKGGTGRAPPAGPPPTDVAPAMTAIVADFRGVMTLLADEPGADDPATTVAWLLAGDQHDRLEALGARVAGDAAAAAAFLDQLEGAPAYHDADKLAFRDLLA